MFGRRLRLINSIFTIFLIQFFIVSYASGSIDKLKGTYSILKDAYKPLSVINGAVADHKDFVLRLYDYGAMKDKTIDSRGIEYQVPDLKNALEAVKLTHLFYNRIPGSTGRGDFVITKELADAPDKIKLAKELAKVVAGIAAVTNKFAGRSFITKDEKANLMKQGTRARIELVKLKSMFQVYSSLLEEFDLKDKPKGEVVRAAIFPVNLTLTIVLTVLYKLCGDSKEALRAYYEELDRLLNVGRKEKESIFVGDAIPEGWEQEEFDPEKEEVYKEAVLQLKDADLDQIVKHFEELVYVALSPGKYPPIEGYATAFFYYDEKNPSKNVSFPDCMDNTFRNMVNVFLYNEETKQFDLDYFAKKIQKEGDKKFNEKFLNFYKDPLLKLWTEAGTSRAHNEWIKVVSNIPFATYNKIISKPQLQAREDSVGYIHIPEEFRSKNFFNEKKYKIVGDDEILYEIMPALRNVIIVFNYLFRLDLFAQEEGEGSEKIINAFVRDDFVKHYFPIMCQRLGISHEGWNEEGKEEELGDNVDKLDYDKSPIITKLKIDSTLDEPDFELKTIGCSHGQLSLIGEDAENEGLNWIKKRMSEFFSLTDNRLFVFPYFCCSIFFNKSINILSKFSVQRLFETFFWLPMSNWDFFTDLVEENFKVNSFIVDCLNYFANKVPDPNFKKEALMNVKRLLIASSKQLTEETVDEGIKLAEKGSNDEDYDVRRASLALWKALLAKGQGVEQAISMAEIGSKSDDLYSKQTALMLLELILKNGYGFDRVIQLIEQSDDQSENLNLLRYGVESIEKANPELRGIIFNKAIDIIEKETVFNLLKALVDKIKYIDGEQRNIVVNESLKFISNIDYGSSPSDSLFLCTSLIKNIELMAFDQENEILNKSIEFVSMGTEERGEVFQGPALNLGINLIEKIELVSSEKKTQVFDKAIEVAKIGLNFQDKVFRKDAFILWEALFKKGHGFEEAEEIDNPELRELLGRYRSLEKAKKVEKAIEETKAPSKIVERSKKVNEVDAKTKIAEEPKGVEDVSTEVVEEVLAEKSMEEVKKVDVKEFQEDEIEDSLKKQQEEPREMEILPVEIKAEEEMREVEQAEKAASDVQEVMPEKEESFQQTSKPAGWWNYMKSWVGY